MENPVDRYRLALALIPDADVAGDLFMAARDEADLRRRAERWRARQGLSPADGALVLPLLDEPTAEYALHLARRGARHRRMTIWLTAAALLLGITAGGYLLGAALLPSLDSNPAFSRGPLATAEEAEGLILSVYHIEVTALNAEGQTGTHLVSIWWEVVGPGASDAYQRFHPELGLQVKTRPGGPMNFSETTTTRRYSTRPSQVLGVSQFQISNRYEQPEALFRLIPGEPGKPDLAIIVQLPPAQH